MPDPPSANERELADEVRWTGDPTVLTDILEDSRTFIYKKDKNFQTIIEKGYIITRYGSPGFPSAAAALCHKLGLIPVSTLFDCIDPAPDYFANLLTAAGMPLA